MIKIHLKYKGFATMIMGAIEARKGKKKTEEGKKLLAESDKYIPAEEDSEQRFALNRIQTKRDSLYSGSYASTLFDDLNQNYANMTEGALSLASGGGADVTALMRNGKSVSQAFNQTIGGLEQQGFAYEKEAQTQLENILQRKLELQLLKHQEKRYDATSMIAAGDMQNMAGKAAAAAGIEDIVSTVLGIFNMNKGKSSGDTSSAGKNLVSATQATGGNESKDNANKAKASSDSGGMDNSFGSMGGIDAFIGGFGG